MKKNALDRGQVECAKIANEALIERFSIKAKRGRGPTPTTAMFRSLTESFDTGKDAYIWLIEEFTVHREDALERYVDLHKHAGERSRGCRFAKNQDDLFPKNSSRTGNPTHYVALSSGWYADTDLNHRDKFATLMQLSHVCGLEYGTEWDFRVSGATEELREHQEAILHARKLLNELLAI